jgi:hypothetical protein
MSDAARFCVTAMPPRDRMEGFRTRRRWDRLGETTETVLCMAAPALLVGRSQYRSQEDWAP